MLLETKLSVRTPPPVTSGGKWRLRHFFYIVLAVGLVILLLMALGSKTMTLRQDLQLVKVTKRYKPVKLDIGQVKDISYKDLLPPHLRPEEVGDTPLVTLFTTFKNAPDRYVIHSNVLKNWVRLGPAVTLILFTSGTDVRLAALARELGWVVTPAPRLSKLGIPFLRDMYIRAKQLTSSHFYGYCNGDILFTDGLVRTLESIVDLGDQLNRTLVVGQRSNVKIRNRVVYKPSAVDALVRREGRLFLTNAEDYFLIKHNDFPWSRMPQLVIGRPAYDNYLVGMAITNGVSTIDATQTVRALHQTGKDGDFAGHAQKDPAYNRRAIGRFNYNLGFTTSSQYYTRWSDDLSEVEVWKRGRRPVKLQKQIPTTTQTAVTSTATSQQQQINATQMMEIDDRQFVIVKSTTLLERIHLYVVTLTHNVVAMVKKLLGR